MDDTFKEWGQESKTTDEQLLSIKAEALETCHKILSDHKKYSKTFVQETKKEMEFWKNL